MWDYFFKQITSSSSNSNSRYGSNDLENETKEEEEEDGRCVSSGVKWCQTIVGNQISLNRLEEAVLLPLKFPILFNTLGVTHTPKGVLVHGPSGTGKSEMVVSMMRYLEENEGMFVFQITPSSSLTTISNLESIFERACRHAPSLIVIDNLEDITPSSSSSSSSPIIGCLGRWLDELTRRNARVMIVGISLHLSSIHSSLLRNGRFSKLIPLSIPNENDRIHILSKFTSEMKIDDDLRLSTLSSSLHGYSGADLQSLCYEAGMNCIRRNGLNELMDIPIKVL